jgi:FAD/FMN-containing dehydrogenase
MKSIGKTIFAIILVSNVLAGAFTTAPTGCLKLPTDSDWPAPEVWTAQLPGIIPRKERDGDQPNYRIRPKNAAEVQKAVKFAKDHNIRLSVLVSGHGIYAVLFHH